MKTLQEKLKLVPSPIREMIEECLRTTRWEVSPEEDQLLEYAFHWSDNNVLNDMDFWYMVREDLEYHAEQFNKKKKKQNKINKSMMNHNINAC